MCACVHASFCAHVCDAACILVTLCWRIDARSDGLMDRQMDGLSDGLLNLDAWMG